MKTIQSIFKTLLIIIITIIILIPTLATIYSINKYMNTEIIYENQIGKNKYYVFKNKKGLKCLAFDLVSQYHSEQTCIDDDDINKVQHEYNQLMLKGPLFFDDLKINKPKKILIIGLGGGVLSRALSAIFPNCFIDIIEIDSEVIFIAKEYFHFQETDRVRVIHEDGLQFVTDKEKNNSKYDLIFMDAFDNKYIPSQFLNIKFVQSVKKILTIGGVYIVNTFAHHKTRNEYDIMHKKTFKSFIDFQAIHSGNRILIMKNFQSSKSKSDISQINTDENTAFLINTFQEADIDFTH